MEVELLELDAVPVEPPLELVVEVVLVLVELVLPVLVLLAALPVVPEDEVALPPPE